MGELGFAWAKCKWEKGFENGVEMEIKRGVGMVIRFLVQNGISTMSLRFLT